MLILLILAQVPPAAGWIADVVVNQRMRPDPTGPLSWAWASSGPCRRTAGGPVGDDRSHIRPERLIRLTVSALLIAESRQDRRKPGGDGGSSG